jgi:adenine-specific DNA methylase
MKFKKLVTQILKLSSDIENVEKSIVYAFAIKIKCNFKHSAFFNNYFKYLNMDIVNTVSDYVNKNNLKFTIYTLVEIFEMLMPCGERKEKGTVYTPTTIKDYIIKSLITSDSIPTICDPACGCGSFLMSAAEYIHKKYTISYNDIFKKYIYGVDIMEHNINKSIVLFNLLAIISNEVIEQKFNLIAANSLCLDWQKKFRHISQNGFDIVVGNPPYVRSRNINKIIRKEMRNWSTSKIGNVDLYIPFYELGLKILNDTGKLGYISPNTFIQSVNGRFLRKYLQEEKYNISLLDFREAQVFKNVTNYTCIALIDKSFKGCEINYALLNGKSSLYDYSFTKYDMNSFESMAPWRMGEKKIDNKIRKIENIGIKLDSFKIRNGLATLKNEIFFYTPIKEDRHYYYRNYKGIIYKIEKNICINVAKPNIIRTEKELAEKMQKAIFPYTKSEHGYTIINEKSIRQLYPFTYKFLLTVKEELLKRDKGEGNYPKWYAYGRMQGMSNFGSKLLLPYISSSPVAVLSKNNDVLFYCGYAVFSESLDELIILKRILESQVFWYYISNTSKPYAKGYMSFAKNYIKNFGIPCLSDKQKKVLISLTDKTELDKYIQGLYDVRI